MSLATEKDLVLSYLNGKREVDLMGLDYMEAGSPAAVFYSLFFKHRFELEQAGFIAFNQNEGVVIDIQRTNIKPAGYVFLLNGGYTAVEQKEIREEQRRQVEWRWRRGYEGGTLFLALVAIGFTGVTFFVTPKTGDVEKLQHQIDSLRQTKPTRVIRSPATENPPAKRLISSPPISSTATKIKE